MSKEILVTKRDGRKEPLAVEKWQAQIAKVCTGIADVSQSMIECESNKEHYIYVYYREKSSQYGEAGSPYYVGLGKNNRAWEKGKTEIKKPKNNQYIIIEQRELSLDAARKMEIAIISHFGRIDIGTGILRNRTDGGEGTSGWKPTEENIKNKKEASKKLWDNDEYKKNHSIGMKIGANTDDAKENYSKASISRWASNRDAIVQAQRQAHCRPEVKENKRTVLYARWQDSEFIEKMTVTCEHCDRTMLKGQYGRWHGVNCKSKANKEMVNYE